MDRAVHPNSEDEMLTRGVLGSLWKAFVAVEMTALSISPKYRLITRCLFYSAPGLQAHRREWCTPRG